ncbi:MAG: DJ-1/PfpI family protein [Nitrospirota bacterium]|nr:DJ-1/PfpI family protein [Nitrospirota bacterium]
MKLDWSLLTTGSVLFDAVYIPGGDKSVHTLLRTPKARMFVHEAYLHCKAIAATGAGVDVLQGATALPGLSKSSAKVKGKNESVPTDEGIVTARDSSAKQIAGRFIKAIEPHRHWSREIKLAAPE